MSEGQIMNIGDKFSIREEQNGITVYEKHAHIYTFYEAIYLKDVEENVAPATVENLESYLDENKGARTTNVQSKFPFYIGWQLSGNCNLNCIYCFADYNIHQENTKDIVDVAKHMLSLHPISVGLSGGEPTLNPYLPEIIKLFSGKVSIVLNTNGTTKQLEKLIPLLKEAGAIVRMTIDTFDNELLNELRPPVRMPTGGFDQTSMFRYNIKLLQDAGIPFMVHTVITQKNLNRTDELAEELIGLGVTRWHMYKVDLTYKCKDIYDDIKVSIDIMRDNHDRLVEKYGDKLQITSALAVSGHRERAVLLVDSTGRFLVDTASDGVHYIGENPRTPSIEEIHEAMDYETHKKCYVSNYWGK